MMWRLIVVLVSCRCVVLFCSVCVLWDQPPRTKPLNTRAAFNPFMWLLLLLFSNFLILFFDLFCYHLPDKKAGNVWGHTKRIRTARDSLSKELWAPPPPPNSSTFLSSYFLPVLLLSPFIPPNKWSNHVLSNQHERRRERCNSCRWEEKWLLGKQ